MKPSDPADALTSIVKDLLAYAANRHDLDRLISVLDRVQDIGWSRFCLVDIPEPSHLDRLEKALAASVVERLVQVYTAPPHGQRQTVPAWCATVAPSPVEVWLIDPRWASGLELNPIFGRRNIVALADFLWFV